MNEWPEILTPAEVNLISMILRIDVSMGDEKRDIIRFIVAEGKEPIEMYCRLRSDYQDDAIKKYALYFWIAQVPATGRDISSHSSTAPQLHSSTHLSST